MRNYESLPEDHQKKIIDTIIDLLDFSFWTRRKKFKAIEEVKTRAWEYCTIEGMTFLFGNKPEVDVVSVIISEEGNKKKKTN